MYLSITNVGHKNTKYFIVDQSDELNLPNIPEGYSLVFQEKYTNNIKVINDEEFKKIFQNNTLLYEIVEFNSSFKISEEDIEKQVKNEIENILSNKFKISSSFKLNTCNKNIVNFVNNPIDIYNKDEIDEFQNSIQNKINKIKYYINVLKNEQCKVDKDEIYQSLNNFKNDINKIKKRINLCQNQNLIKP